MRSLFDLCVDTLRTTSDNNNTKYDDVFGEIGIFLGALSARGEEVRLFVAGSLNYGHQSTSVVIMNHLISLGQTRIRIVYQRSTNTDTRYQDEETDVKLSKLIPGLTLEDINKGEYTYVTPGRTATLYFSRFEGFSGDKVTLGLSGGFDQTRNIAPNLSVKCLIVLQPFRYLKWGAKNIIYFHPDDYPTKNALELPEDFLQKGFYIEDPAEPNTYLNTPVGDLEGYKQNFRLDFRTKLAEKLIKKFAKTDAQWNTEPARKETLIKWMGGEQVTQEFLNLLGDALLGLLDEEGLNDLKEVLRKELGKEPEKQDLRNAVLASTLNDCQKEEGSALNAELRRESQTTPTLSDEWKRLTVKSALGALLAGNIQLCPVYFSQGRTRYNATTVLFNLLTGLFQMEDSATNKPIVMLVMSKFSPDIYQVLKWIISGEREYWEDNPTGQTVQQVQKWSPFLSLSAYTYMSQSGYFDRFKKVKIIHLGDDLQQAVAAAGNGGVVIVDLQRVPKLVFEYLYSVGTLPGIFEGEATASLILNLGRPYFHIGSLQAEETMSFALYPYPVLPGQTLSQTEVSDYCYGFSYYFGDHAWYPPESTPPQDVFLPDRAIADYIKNAYTVLNPPYPLQVYFKSLRSFFHKEEEDKLIQALVLALPEMEGRGINLS